MISSQKAGRKIGNVSLESQPDVVGNKNNSGPVQHTGRKIKTSKYNE